MIRLYAYLTSIGDDSRYTITIPAKISLTPFGNNCYYVDLEGSNEYLTAECKDRFEVERQGNTLKGTFCWKPYNDTCTIIGYKNPESGELSLEADPNYIFGMIVQKYENGRLVCECFINPKDLE